MSDSTYLDFNPIARDSKLGGLKANFYEAPNGYCDGPGCSSPFVAFETRLDLTQFVIQFSGDLKLDEDENRVLSTFKFTK